MHFKQTYKIPFVHNNELWQIVVYWNFLNLIINIYSILLNVIVIEINIFFIKCWTLINIQL